jgi:CRP-like cAMP-binding protein
MDIFNVCKKSIKDRSEAETSSVINYLQKNFAVFEKIDKGEIKEISGKIMPLTFEKDEVILKEGDMGDYLVILYEGEVEVYRASSNIKKGAKNKMLAYL